MKKRFRFLLLCFIFVCMAILAGCSKENAGSLNTPDVIQQSTSQQEESEQSQDTVPQEQDIDMTFDYAPGSMGIYVKADPADLCWWIFLRRCWKRNRKAGKNL